MKFTPTLSTKPAILTPTRRRSARAARTVARRAAPTPVVPHHHAKTNAVNEAGGHAFRKSPQFELLSLVFCALLSARKTPKFYESEASILERLHRLVRAHPLFAAKAAVWARRIIGLRSISHAVAASVCYHTKGQGLPWVRQFVQAVVFRPDDAIEIVAAYFAFFGGSKSIRKPSGRGKRVPVVLPNPLKKGIADALSGFDGYHLAKYQKTNQAIRLVDLFNLVHPKPNPTRGNGAAFRQFVRGELANTDTWEARLSAAGNDREKKAEVWEGLLRERRLGYLAALRNVRNILEQAPKAVDLLLALIRNDLVIEKSLILPFQFARAYREVTNCGLPRAEEAAKAIEYAIEAACRNIPRLEGTTLVALDQSGSMQSPQDDGTPANIGSLMAAAVLKSQPGAEFMAFGSNARYQQVNNNDAFFQIVRQVRDRWDGGSTNFHSIFNTARHGYDNVIILSDGEGWTMGERWEDQAGAPTSARRRWEQKFFTGRNNVAEATASGKLPGLPFIVMFDLTGSKTMMFPEDSVAVLSGFSDKVFTLLRELRRDPQALIREVEKTDFAAINEADEE